ncbi:DnaJ domain-containing protein [Kiloniella laminariae]|uniref:DnaJ domain-containing protein n=1 Tax=Kiloniella laminariae TaxID=454162 RepID=A0ABT4LE81_9PROT|nr:DnaJ domain-containing protein [Kiloniella laminariae]MCZ4279404.1 DnaJ domain-containing protein [Kiloniella laminariae]
MKENDAVIAYFLAGVALLLALIFLAQWYSQASPSTIIKTLKRLAISLGLFVALFLILTGRVLLVLGALPLLLPVLLRYRGILQRLKMARGPAPGQFSEVVTRFLQMRLDHTSGEMSGQVISGTHEGKSLSDLPPEVIAQLYRDYRLADTESADLILAYAQRRFGSDWMQEEDGATAQDSRENKEGLSDAVMDKKQALEILGLKKGASAEEIREAHRSLMQKLHPDHGGSTFLATQINRAKDVLLKGPG